MLKQSRDGSREEQTQGLSGSLEANVARFVLCQTEFPRREKADRKTNAVLMGFRKALKP